MNPPPFSALFTMSAFEALRNIRRFRCRHPELSSTDLINLIAKLIGGLDYATGIYLDQHVKTSIDPNDATLFYRDCIESIIDKQPIWLRAITLGRQKFVQKLSRDQEQCFRLAGLLETPFTDTLIVWWDSTVSRMRQIRDYDVMKRARTAERLSLEHERRRLDNIKISSAPVWMSLEDNTVGYDILSYDKGYSEPITRLIEVKSTIISPLRFFLSRGEWETARKFGQRYFFHVWDLRGPQLYERSMNEVSQHIPTDNAGGRWNSVEISLT